MARRTKAEIDQIEPDKEHWIKQDIYSHNSTNKPRRHTLQIVSTEIATKVSCFMRASCENSNTSFYR